MKLKLLICASLGGTNGVTILMIPKLSCYLSKRHVWGFVLGPITNKGNYTTQWIIRDSGKIIPRCTASNLTAYHLSPRNVAEKRNTDTFNKEIRYIICYYFDLPTTAPDPISLSEYDDERICDLRPSIFDCK